MAIGKFSTTNTNVNQITTGIGTTTLHNHSNWYNGHYDMAFSTYYNFETKTLDIEKLSTLDENKRKLIFDLFINFLNCKDDNSKKIMYNTLEVYNVIIEKSALERKIKVSKLLNEK